MKAEDFYDSELIAFAKKVLESCTGSVDLKKIETALDEMKTLRAKYKEGDYVYIFNSDTLYCYSFERCKVEGIRFDMLGDAQYYLMNGDSKRGWLSERNCFPTFENAVDVYLDRIRLDYERTMKRRFADKNGANNI